MRGAIRGSSLSLLIQASSGNPKLRVTLEDTNTQSLRNLKFLFQETGVNSARVTWGIRMTMTGIYIGFALMKTSSKESKWLRAPERHSHRKKWMIKYSKQYSRQSSMSFQSKDFHGCLRIMDRWYRGTQFGIRESKKNRMMSSFETSGTTQPRGKLWWNLWQES